MTEIIETITEEKAWGKQDETHIAYVERMQNLGYAVVYVGDPGYENIIIFGGYDENGHPTNRTLPNGLPGVVPMVNGVPNYGGQITWAWDTLQVTPEGRHIFYADTANPLPQDSEFEQTWVQKPMPEEYYNGYSGDDFSVDFDNQTIEV